MKKYLIYKYTSPNGKSYIGQTCNLQKRKESHGSKRGNGCRVFNRAVKKYGIENFTFEILEVDLNLEDANVLEELYIEEFNSIVPNGYNLQSGGLNKNHSIESREKMRISQTGKHVGEKNIMFGKTHTKESIEKNKHSNIGKQAGKNNAMYGTTEELCPVSKAYIMTFSDTHEELIYGLRQFCILYSLDHSYMTKIAKNKPHHKSHKGFKCRYATPEEIANHTQQTLDNQL